MATKKSSTNTTNDEVEVIAHDVDNDTREDTPKGEVKDGIYVEEDVELGNGNKIEVEVITDYEKLPATYGSLLSEGNGPAMIIASVTSKTRRIMDLTGATQRDLNEVISPVVARSRDAVSDNES